MPSEFQFYAEQMDGKLLKYDIELVKYKLALFTSATNITDPITPARIGLRKKNQFCCLSLRGRFWVVCCLSWQD